MRFLSRLSRSMQPLSRYIMTRGSLLSCALLVSALLMMVWGGAHTPDTRMLYEYADYTVTMAMAVMGAGLFGALAMEDMLRRAT